MTAAEAISRGLGCAARHDGLPDEPHPDELEQQRERHGCGKRAHGVAVQDRGGAGEGAEPHELEHPRARKTDQTSAACQLYGRRKHKEQAAKPRLACHHLRRGKARRVGELVRGGHRAIAGPAGKYLQGGRNLAMLRRRGVRRWRLRIDRASHVLSLLRPASRGAWLCTFRAFGRETMRLAIAPKEKATRPKLGCVAKRWLAPRKVHTILDGLNCRGFFENVKQEWSDRPRLLTALTLRP